MLALTSAAIAGGEEVSGVARIATSEGTAARLVRDGLLQLRARYPALELFGGNRLVDLMRGEAELAVRFTRTTEPQLKVRVLGCFPIALYASPRYLRARDSAQRQASRGPR